MRPIEHKVGSIFTKDDLLASLHLALAAAVLDAAGPTVAAVTCEAYVHLHVDLESVDLVVSSAVEARTLETLEA